MIKAIGLAHKKTDIHIDETNNTVHEILRLELINKDKLDKSNQIMCDLLDQKDKTDTNKDDAKANDDVVEMCCEINKNVKVNYQILMEKNDNTKKIQNQQNQTNQTSEIIEKLSKMENKISNDLELKNEILNKNNIDLKERITNMNKFEWSQKFKQINPKNLNITNVSDTETVKSLNSEEKFKCYSCDKRYDTLNTLMNHKHKNHKSKTKCKNINNCFYNLNCWFSHEDEDKISVKTYCTT